MILCLAFSSGLHAGAAYFDWQSSPVMAPGGDAPVVVALLSTDHKAPNSPVEVKDIVKPEAVSKQSAVKKKVVKAPIVKPRVEPSAVISKQDPPKEPITVDAKKPSDNVVSADLVCIDPQEQKVGLPLDVVNEDNQAATGQQNVITEIPVEKMASFSAKNDVNTQGGQREKLQEAVPRYRVNPKPEYPYVAAKRRWEGVVWLLVDVSSEGLVNNLQVEQSCGYRVLDKAARNSVKHWEFIPAMRAGLPVESQVRIPVRFQLEDS